MTNQDAFTKVVQHLRTQGVPSKVSGTNNRCLYRHTDGIRKCAVGVLIPDDEYIPEMELQLLEEVASTPSLKGLTLGLLLDLQVAHDISYPLGSWRAHMERQYTKIALRHNLQVPPHPCLELQLDESDQSSGQSEAYLLTQQA